MKRRIHESQDPLALRLGEYGSMGDQLDALWKIVGVLVKDAHEDTLHKIRTTIPEAHGHMEQIVNAKKKFPKRKAKP